MVAAWRSIWRTPVRRTLAAVLLSSPILISCTPRANALAPRGPAAEQIAGLWWIMFWMATAIFVVVIGLMLYALFRRRGGNDRHEAPPGGGLTFVIGGGVVLPLLVLPALFVMTLLTMNSLDARANQSKITVQVIGHQWWWEVRYPDYQFETANEIRIPVGTPVRLELTSADVQHSFWVPELHGKMDMYPGESNTFWIEASTAGEYYGECAEFCGMQHAKMAFLVIAEPADRFERWVELQQQPAVQPLDEQAEEGRQIFLGSACVYCHAVRGTNAQSDFGPDLTHLASRRTIGAGILENNRGNLAGWIMNPQTIKPGNKMPPTELTGEELNILLAYLETLE